MVPHKKVRHLFTFIPPKNRTMNITALSICPPPAAAKNPSVTPELLASTLARYSRSNKGIHTIMESIDWNDPDRSVDAIFRFVDYGHASIGGMTGGIPVVVDGCSMFLAYKIFELAQLCDGQESSTRYITLDSSQIPDAAVAGIPLPLADEWRSIMDLSFTCYHELYSVLDKQAQADPSIIRCPEGAGEKVIDRLRKNYALDRARYFIPFATKTNAAYIMTARVWAETVKLLDSLPLPEAHTCAAGIRAELMKYAPRLMRHSFPDAASISQAQQSTNTAVQKLREAGLLTANIPDDVYLQLQRPQPPFLASHQTIPAAFDGKVNRYSITGPEIRRMSVHAAWNNIAIAELRDLNRHRSGFRMSPLTPVGFYLPEGIAHPKKEELLDRSRVFIDKLLKTDASAAYLYALHLGTQVPFEHATQLDKFIYEIELRTGMGAHFRYADHLAKACTLLCKQMPELKPFITVGSAEPE